MSRRSRLLALYRGAALGPKASAGTGAISGQLASGRRRVLLQRALESGRIRQDRLGPNDRAILGQVTRQQGPGVGGTGAKLFGVDVPGVSKGIGFFKNLLGERGLYGALTGLPAGLYETGKAVVEDIKEEPALLGGLIGGPAGLLGAVGVHAALDPESETREKVVDPVIESYKYQYGPLAEGDIGEFGKRFYQQPLGPLLDVAAVGSLGAAGAGRVAGAVQRTGRGGLVTRQLANMTSPRGREPLPVTRGILSEAAERAGVEAPQLERFYSRGPLRKLSQMAITDPILGGPIGRARIGDLSIAEFSQKRGINRMVDELKSREGLTVQRNVQLEGRDLGEALAQLSPAESTALALIQRGVNTPERLQKMADFWSASLRGENPEGANITDFPEVPRKHTEYLASLPQNPEVLRLIQQPESSPALIQAARAWETAQVAGREKLGVDPEAEAAHLANREALLRGDQEPPAGPQPPPSPRGGGGGPGPTTPPSFPPSPLLGQEPEIPPFQVPEVRTETGPSDAAQAAWDALLRGEEGRPEPEPPEFPPDQLPTEAEIPEFTLGDIGQGPPEGPPPPVDYGEPGGFEPDLPRPDYPIRPSYVPDISTEGMQFRAPGALRTGEPQLLPGGVRRERVREPDARSLFVPSVQPYLHSSQLETFRAGVFRTDPSALMSHVAKRERDLVETYFNNEALNAVALRDQDGVPAKFKSQTELDRAVGTLGDYVLVYDDLPTRWYRAEHNVLQQVVARIDRAREEGDVGPQLSEDLLAELNKMLDDDAQAFVQSYLGAAKTSGVAVPQHFYRRMQQQAKTSDSFAWEPVNFYVGALNKWRTLTLAYMPRWWVNTAVGSFFLNTLKGVWNPRDYQQAFRLSGSADLPADVRLGGMVAAEQFGPGRPGLRNSIFPTRKLYEWVQRVEDTFRTASFVHSLRREDKQRMAEIGESMRTMFPFGRRDDDYIDELLLDPELTRHAVNQVNRFSYNYMQLGPNERRYVRQFIPFYGWYKFITKFVWRMPLEYPGRLAVLTKLGLVGQEALEEAFGEDAESLPPWIRDAVLLSKDPKNIKYLSTGGLNPFGSFANPFAEQGVVAGLAGLGQASPLIQAGLAGMGIDPFTGDRIGISPEEPVGTDFLGRMFNTETGKEIRGLSEVAGGRRTVASLLRSVPQYRIGEVIQAGGRPVYPESLPFVAERPIGVRPETRRDVSVPGLLGEYSGIRSRSFDLERARELDEASLKYARKRRKSQQKRHRERLGQ